MIEGRIEGGAGRGPEAETAPWRALVFVADDTGAAAAIRWAFVTLLLAAAALLAALCA